MAGFFIEKQFGALTKVRVIEVEKALSFFFFFFKVGGVICVFFSSFLGILAIYLMSHLNPKVDNLIRKKCKNSLKRNTKVIRGSYKLV